MDVLSSGTSGNNEEREIRPLDLLTIVFKLHAIRIPTLRDTILVREDEPPAWYPEILSRPDANLLLKRWP